MPKMRQVGEFHPGDDSRLAEELSRLEENASNAIDALVASAARPYAIGLPISRSGQTAVASKLARVDTTGGDVELFLPRAEDGASQAFPVAKMVAGNTLILRPLTGTINGAAFLNITAEGLRTVIGDGSGYWA